jgi:hypothetical protein
MERNYEAEADASDRAAAEIERLEDLADTQRMELPSEADIQAKVDAQVDKYIALYWVDRALGAK